MTEISFNDYHNMIDLWDSCLKEDYNDILTKINKINVSYRSTINQWSFVRITREANDTFIMIFVDTVDHMLFIKSDKGKVEITGNTEINYGFFHDEDDDSNEHDLKPLYFAKFYNFPSKSSYPEIVKFLITEHQRFFMVCKIIMKHLGLENIWYILKTFMDGRFIDDDISDIVYK